MPEIKLELDALNTGAFNMYTDDQKVGTLLLNIEDSKLMAFHTEVAQKVGERDMPKNCSMKWLLMQKTIV